ncbi:MAG: CRISPR-associated endonuclease Cas2 [Candidatus Micrarchaeaceae archaeon]
MKNLQSKYRMEWFFVIFDIPVTTKKERQIAHKFRNNLLDKGYLMLQYSVYTRCAVTFDRKESLIRDLESINPGIGEVRCFFITDAQWTSSILLHSKPYSSKYKIETEKNNDQLQFW